MLEKEDRNPLMEKGLMLEKEDEDNSKVIFLIINQNV